MTFTRQEAINLAAELNTTYQGAIFPHPDIFEPNSKRIIKGFYPYYAEVLHSAGDGKRWIINDIELHNVEIGVFKDEMLQSPNREWVVAYIVNNEGSHRQFHAIASKDFSLHSSNDNNV